MDLSADNTNSGLINHELKIRKQILTSTLLLVTLAWINGMIITHLLSPFNTLVLALVVLSCTVWVLLSAIAIYCKKKNIDIHQPLSLITVGWLCFSMLVLACDSFFGSQSNLIFSDRIPTVVFGCGFTILLAFCLLNIRQAIWTSVVFSVIFFLIVVSHLLVYQNHYEPTYGIGVTLGVALLMNPATIAMLIMFYRVYNTEIEQADQTIEAATKAFKTASMNATHDPVTGLLNRFGMWDELNKAYLENPALCMITIKLLNESQVSDFFGSSAMDKLYREIAVILQSVVEDQDCLARREGGEYVLWPASVINADQLETMGRQIIKLLNGISQSHWMGTPQFHGSGRFCSPQKRPSQTLEETLFLVQYGQQAVGSFSTLL